MDWIIKYSNGTPAAQAWNSNDSSGRALISAKAKASLTKLKALLDDEDVSAVLDENARKELAAEYKRLSHWYIDYLKESNKE